VEVLHFLPFLFPFSLFPFFQQSIIHKRTGRLVTSPTGGLEDDTDDVRKIADAAKKGILRLAAFLSQSLSYDDLFCSK
jgi:hypothetical protein